MKIPKIIAWLSFIAMTLALLKGFINGDFFKDGSELLNNPWGIVSIVDLYAGFFFFSIWIWYREKSLLLKILWTVFLMVFGFFAGSIYTLIALYTSENDVGRFLMGSNNK